MVFTIPDNYDIPTSLNFTFTEFCFNNKWSLVWDGYKWTGENCQGRTKDKTYSASRIDEKSKNIVLYLNMDYVEPIDEINWDSTTNAFDYIIKMQFYEITPRPDAATTLNTDYNITSSKIITTDNITTMRSDLNLVANTLDVVNVDVSDLTNKVGVLNTEMVEVRQITDNLQKDVKKKIE